MDKCELWSILAIIDTTIRLFHLLILWLAASVFCIISFEHHLDVRLILLSFLCKNQVLIKKKSNNAYLKLMALTCKIFIDCQQVFLPVFAENASSKEKNPRHYSFIRVEIFLTSRVWHSFASSVQEWLGYCPGKYCMHASTSLPRCTSRHLWHRRGSFPAPTECSTAHWGWESAFPSNISLGMGAVLDPTAKQPSCWQNS